LKFYGNSKPTTASTAGQGRAAQAATSPGRAADFDLEPLRGDALQQDAPLFRIRKAILSPTPHVAFDSPTGPSRPDRRAGNSRAQRSQERHPRRLAARGLRHPAKSRVHPPAAFASGRRHKSSVLKEVTTYPGLVSVSLKV
jgi:hypothetical protein